MICILILYIFFIYFFELQRDLEIELEPLDSRGIYINPREGTITRKDVLKNISNSIIHSKKYTLFYTFIIILSIIMLIAVSIKYKKKKFFF